MSVTSVGASTSAYAYLQSLLPPSAANDGSAAVASDPVTELLQAFYPPGESGQPTAGAASSGGTNAATSTTGTPGFSPDTMASLISVQGEPWNGGSIADRAQSLFQQFDSNGDGQIGKSEFEGAFGANADQSKVDGLFNALDANGDGSVSQDELTAAAQQSQAHHHHHHHTHSAEPGGGGGGGLAGLLSSTDLTGATSQTASNPDGSSSTSISYADGSTVTMTTPATSGSGSSDTSSTGASASSRNLLEQLIRLQAQFLTPTDSQVLATV